MAKIRKKKKGTVKNCQQLEFSYFSGRSATTTVERSLAISKQNYHMVSNLTPRHKGSSICLYKDLIMNFVAALLKISKDEN